MYSKVKLEPSSISVLSKPDPWFVCPQAKPKAEFHLFFFPYAGGGPPVFSKWLSELPNHMEAYIAHYPGRGSRYQEPAINRLTTLVESLSQAIHSLLDKPFAFYGHSLGGLVAFELTRQLRGQNLPPPKMLFVSACGAPHIPDPHPPIHKLPDVEFLGALQELNGIPSEFQNNTELMKLLLPTLRADFEAVESYRLIFDEFPLDVPIIAYGGLDDPRVSRDRLEGWASFTNAGFKSQYFPGGHFFINTARESVIASIAAELASSNVKKAHSKTVWSPAPDVLDLEPHQVDIWRVSLNLPTATVKIIETLLSADEFQRATRFHFPVDRDRYIVAHTSLRGILARYLHCEPHQLSFTTGEYGKPALISNEGIDFNLAHSGDYALIAITRGRKVGVDVEHIRQDMELENIAHRYFSQREVTELLALPPEQREDAFFKCWTRKEAYIKAQGLGLSLPLESFDVSLTPDEPAILRATRPASWEAARWVLLPVEVDAHYAAAVAIENATSLEFRLLDWNT